MEECEGYEAIRNEGQQILDVAREILRKRFEKNVCAVGFPTVVSVLADRAVEEDLEKRGKRDYCRSCTLKDACGGVLEGQDCMPIPDKAELVKEAYKRAIPVFEVVQVLDGIRGAWLTSMNNTALKIVAASAARHKYAVVSASWDLGVEKDQFIFLQRDIAKARELAQMYISPRTPEEIQKGVGSLLEYPKCCVDAHEGWIKLSRSGKELEANYEVYKRSKRRFWELNYIYNFQTRIASKEEFELFEEYRKINEKYGILPSHLSLISWIPHSLDCEESLKIARETFNALKKYLPEFAEKLRKMLSRPVLVLGKWEWYTIEPERLERKGDVVEITVKSVEPPIAPVQNEDIGEGSVVRVKDGAFEVEIDGKARKGYLIVFDNAKEGGTA